MVFPFCCCVIQFGFVGSKADLSLFVHTDTSSIIYILIYVNDIIITGSNVVAVVITYIIHIRNLLSLILALSVFS